MGAHRVIVMDRLDHRLSLAQQFGADSTINVEEFNTAKTRQERVMAGRTGAAPTSSWSLLGDPNCSRRESDS